MLRKKDIIDKKALFNYVPDVSSPEKRMKIHKWTTIKKNTRVTKIFISFEYYGSDV